ncbi:MAG TPA: 2-oxoacid:acceptor oxidoreductase family protein [Desulfomonilaceae bacterium]|nr:2-oxoacid:acceptor oxidoreductase family protein [Desulfomonilaceae bacterium]
MSQRVQAPLPFPRVEVRLVGSGGQGLILAGLVLAEAAGVFDGREVAMVQSYGPEARGGASKAEVIISDAPIDYPLCTSVDLLVALNQEACDTYCWDLKPGAHILVDKDLVLHPPSSLAIALPFTATARDKLKRIMVANIVALGAISEVAGIVTRRALEKALLTRVPPGTEDLNKKALSLGAKLARMHGEKQNPEDDQDAEAESL